MDKGKTINCWNDVQDLYESLCKEKSKQWLYRGQGNCIWELVPSLERVCRRFKLQLSDMVTLETWLLGEFRRHAHRYLKNIPTENDTMRWLALMQHHGAPTRLLDFSYSFYVGVYFAIEDAKPGDHGAVWAVDADWCWTRAQLELPRKLVNDIEKDSTRGKTPELQAKVLAHKASRVVPDNPFFLDERLAVQQGVFLFPLDLTKPFMENLCTDQKESKGHIRKYEIICTLKFLKEAMEHLHRMNISRGSLFPDLDGFSKGLEMRVATVDPKRILGAAEHGV